MPDDTRYATYCPPPADPPDLEFRETLAGGHALITEYWFAEGHALRIEYGDSEFHLSCECGTVFVEGLSPRRAWLPAIRLWAEHIPEHPYPGPSSYARTHCQCGRDWQAEGWCYGYPEDWVAQMWERHTMTELEANRG